MSPVENVPSLVDLDGVMPRFYGAFARGWFTGMIRERDVRLESHERTGGEVWNSADSGAAV